MTKTLDQFAKALFFALVFAGFAVAASAQEPTLNIGELEAQLAGLELRQDSIKALIEDAKLAEIRAQMKALGYPEGEVIEHSAMALSYDENHEQARWVMHVISPEVIKGSVGRTNDFRPDPKVSTGSAVEADYFLKELNEDGTYTYDGFGFDRGHLAPSADFRWSYQALSESYYYSNMSPQRAVFNRGGWADLEDAMRAYVYRNPEQPLYVITLPVLHDSLPRVERSVNRVSIPDQYIKVAIDPVLERGIAFVMPNGKINDPLPTYAITIREAEELVGLDFFPSLDEEVANRIESAYELSDWFAEEMLGDVQPLDPTKLPRGHFNTVQASRHVGSGKDIIVCGTVVGSRIARSGNAWLNLDRQYPNQVFSVYIKEEHLVNFSYNPDEYLINTPVCVKGRVMDLGGTPTMRIENEKAITLKN